ncbi:hypothetical protein PK28_01610 [Hymenobacter sp. DG25B]|uniref:NADAR family protein n=1 Tax=Hymenobacter sp. DG25B TaxID=1385664 RepID=UPI000540E000|nr:NADAR family protein [Hymenobacter sp. DG25B]AIZ62702.1 hypothetical protein PK28_01610 [Hymenobacter sp. DG25B]
MAAALASVRSLEALLDYLSQRQPVKYLFFWGHTGRPGAAVGKECFSQWYPAPFTLNGQTYATTEHYMMAEKARLFQDEATRQAILAAPHPHQAKTLGRQVQNFEEGLWNDARFAIVVQGNLAKFSQYPALRQFLLDTGQRVLVEASPVDVIWGIGLAQDDPRAANSAEWPGLNLLGFALMEVRAQLSR